MTNDNLNKDVSGKRVNIDYIKSNHFRTIVPTGGMCSITPLGQIQFALFSERQAIPQRVVQKLNDDGALGDIVETVTRDSIVREVEVAVTMDPDTAMVLAAELIARVNELKEDQS